MVLRMYKELRLIRNEIIARNDMEVYQLFLDFLNEPKKKMSDKLIERTYAYSLNCESVLKKLIQMKMSENEEYRDKIIYGQLLIWKEIYGCVKVIQKNQKCIENFIFVDYGKNYYKTNKLIEEIIEFYVSSQAAVSMLESHLGTDRYLDKIAENDFIEIDNLILKQERLLNEKLSMYISRYRDIWGNDNLPSIIYHKLYEYDDFNQICTMLQGKQKKVILFIIDGLGWCQYQWHKKVCSEGQGYAYKESIFEWLQETNNSKELILGTPFITDTTAGLSQIFTGQKATVTGLFASKMLNGSRLAEPKRMSDSEIRNIYEISVNPMNSILSNLHISNDVLYCTKYNTRMTGFTNTLYGTSKVKEILPPERVYNVLFDRIEKEQLNDFTSAYLTSIDNTGHTMGAFSNFEKYEHKKIDLGFKNFILELAQNKPDIFNNTISILLTADHGMAETSNRMIYKSDILKALDDEPTARICINNRCAFIYGIKRNEYQNTVKKLQKYFVELNTLVEITTKDSEILRKHMPDNYHKASNLIPDIFIKLVDKGLFYHGDEIEKELYHFAGHGGASINETLVPLIEVNLSEKLLKDLNERFISLL